MSTAFARRPGGWASLVLLLLCLNLTTCQQTDTYSYLSPPATFQGFYPTGIYPTGTTVRQVNCVTTAKWQTSSTFGVCCIHASCQYWTACQTGVLTLGNGTGQTCSPGNTCFARTLFPSSPRASSGPSWIQHFCTTTGYNISTIYREIIPRETAPATITQVITTGGTVGPSPKKTSGPGAEADVDGDGASGAEPGAKPGQGDSRSKETGTPAAVTTESPSKAWIAGAVVGPLVGITALGLLFFWLGKRRGERKTSAGGEEPGQQPPVGHPPPLYSPGPEKPQGMPMYYQQPGEPQRYSMLSPVDPVHELPPAPQMPAELAGR